MPDPIRLVVHKRLTTLLETVEVPSHLNEPATPMTGRVFRGRAIFGSDVKPPGLSILESPLPDDGDPPDAEDNLVWNGRWDLVLQGWVVDDLKNPTDPAHLMLAEVKRVLAVEKAKANPRVPSQGILGLGRNVTNLYIGPGVVRPPEELNRLAYFWLTLGLAFNEDLEQPYVVT